MACNKYVYAAGDTNWVTTFMAGIQSGWKGMKTTSLTNFSATTVCQIAEGSVFEIAGGLYIATSNTAITGSAATAINFIYATGSTTGAVFAWDQTTPTWRDDYQGYYASASSVVKCLGGCYYSGTSYVNKFLLDKGQDVVREFEVAMGDWDMDAAASLMVPHGLQTQYTNIKGISGIIYNDAGDAFYTIPNMKTATGEVDAGFGQTTAGASIIWRLTSGLYDATFFNAISYNRGYLTFKVKLF